MGFEQSLYVLSGIKAASHLIFLTDRLAITSIVPTLQKRQMHYRHVLGTQLVGGQAEFQFRQPVFGNCGQHH